MYDYIIVTHLPAFYKVNLYNQLAKKLNIFVIFVSNETNEKRSTDFVAIESANFEYAVLSENEFQARNKFITSRKLLSLVRDKNYKKILLSGWDLPEFWLIAILSPNKKNCLALESTVLESNTSGIKGLIKKIFLSMVETVFACGDLHVELLKKLDYTKKIKITKGVGIINKPVFENKSKKYEKKFLFIGRLSKVKNLETLINVFNDLPEHKLTIIGDGVDKKHLKNISNKNILFLDTIENAKLKGEFQSNNIFILPSLSETWGLVVEEALYFGLPVIVSENCGASELIIRNVNGFIINPHNEENISNIIQNIDQSTYDRLAENIAKANLDEKDKIQIESYELE
jgi:glycosyltransferase involved in cell wall biosynthesis